MSFDDKTISLLNNVFSEENIRRQNVFVPIFIFIFFKQSDLLDMKFFVARTFDDVVYVSKPISQPKNKFCHQKSLQRKIGLLVKKIFVNKNTFCFSECYQVYVHEKRKYNYWQQWQTWPKRAYGQMEIESPHRS